MLPLSWPNRLKEEKDNSMFTAWLALSPLLCENFKKTCQKTSWLVLQHLWPYLQPTTSPQIKTMSTPLPLALTHDWPHFLWHLLTYIQSLRSVNHPIHRFPKAAYPYFASGLSKLINKTISSNSLFDWHRLAWNSASKKPILQTCTEHVKHTRQKSLEGLFKLKAARFEKYQII